MTRAAEHYSLSTGEIKHLARFLRGADITVGKHWHPHDGSDIADRLVLRISLIKIGARAPVHGQSLNATALCDPGDRHSIARVAVPTCADLERHGDVHRSHDGVQDMRDERLVPQEGRAAQLAAHFLRRTAHVEVDDLRAEIHIDARGLGQLLRVGSRKLHDTWLRLAFVAHSQPRFRRVPQARVRGEHLGSRKAGTQAAAQDPKWPVRDTRHGGEYGRRGQHVGADADRASRCIVL